MPDKILQNPFPDEVRTDLTFSPHKSYELALQDMMDWLILHNKAYTVKEFALAFPFFLNEDDYWALRKRVEEVKGNGLE